MPKGLAGNNFVTPRSPRRLDGKGRGGRVPVGTQPTSNTASRDGSEAECRSCFLTGPKARPATTGASPRRLLLLELVTRDPWAYNSRYFPFVAGVARAAAVDVRWAWFCVRFQARSGDHGIEVTPELSPEGAARLLALVDEVRPTHVLMSHPLSGALGERVRHATGDARLLASTDVARLADQAFDSPFCREPAAGTAWLRDWLGLDDSGLADGYLANAAEPWYGALPGDDEAASLRPPLVVVGGVTCVDPRPLSSNPFFAGLPANALDGWTGCAFCTASRAPTSDPVGDPVDLALAQILAAAASGTLGGRRSGTFQLQDARLFGHLDRFVTRLLAAGAPPGTYEITPRLDQVLEAEATLMAVLPRLGAAGHTLRVGRMGAESLVDAENGRLHKGLTLAQIDRGAEVLKRLVAAFPTAFGWDESFAWVTYSPWTTLDELATLLDAALERGLDESHGWLHTPVELRRGSALLLRAELEPDLLGTAFSDPAWLYEPSQGGIDMTSMVPWRFRDARVEVAFRLIVRFFAAAYASTWPDAVFAGDALYAGLRAEAARRGVPLRRPAHFARAVVRVLGACSALNRESAGASCGENGPSAQPVENTTDRLPGCLPGGGPPDPQAEPDSAMRYGLLATETAPAAPEAVAEQALDLLAAHPAPSDAAAAAAPARSAEPRARRLLQAAIGALPALRGVHLDDVTSGAGAGHLQLALTIEGSSYRLALEPTLRGRACFFRLPPFDVSHDRETPIRPGHTRTLHVLVEAFVRLARRSTPDLLPPGAEGLGDPETTP